MGSIPRQGTEIPHAAMCGQKKKGGGISLYYIKPLVPVTPAASQVLSSHRLETNKTTELQPL